MAGLFRRKQKTEKAQDLDALTLLTLQQRGADLTKSRNIRHYLYGASEDALKPAVAQLAQAGYSVELRPAATGGTWLALAERNEPVDASTVASGRALFERLAHETRGGDYDGWEAALG